LKNERQSARFSDSNPTAAGAAAANEKQKDKPRKLKWKEEREWESMEANILSAEKRGVGFGGTRLPRRIFMRNRVREIFELETPLKTARDKVAHLYARWGTNSKLLQSVPSP